MTKPSTELNSSSEFGARSSELISGHSPGVQKDTSELRTPNSELTSTSELRTPNSELTSTSELRTPNSELTSTSELRTPNSELPIISHRSSILSALRSHQVIIVCGDTGSGKTTQLPKIALELGLGANGKQIACTQPRRIAAVSVANRVAEEFGEPVGKTIGYQHRFERKESEETRIKFMTDGILLAKTRTDPLLRAYDTIIIDEAHERSLNIDFLLGILKRILRKRKDLKVIISSATLDSDLFSEFFDKAPTLHIPGRTYPIQIRYTEPQKDEEQDLARDVTRAVDTLPDNGDILVFLPGERDIRECAESLESRITSTQDEIIPLIASLPASEQQRAFRLSSRRRIILATNVAETSLTIPGIRYVIDSGLARISRYIHRTQVQRLQIEPISQASANQRSGRCGRLGPGICIRLYDEESFARRDRYTAPEILRSSLAGVILTLLDLNLGEITDFPFITPPENSMIREGIRELTELGAITPDQNGKLRLTNIGKKLATMPVEPRLGRIILAADKEAVLPSVLPIAAYMACEDPRRRPIDEKEKADQAHAKFKSKESDFLTTLNMWHWWQTNSKNLSQRKARALCKDNYLSYAKMREWRDLTEQLTTISKRLRLDTNQNTGDNDSIHRSLLSGLLSRIGIYDSESREFRGARGVRFAIHPSSCIKIKKSSEFGARSSEMSFCPSLTDIEIVAHSDNSELRTPNSELGVATSSELRTPNSELWLVASELVDTSRLFARDAAIISPDWLEPIAGPLCHHTYTSPQWDAASGFVRALETVTLYGLTIVHNRRCDYSRVATQDARDIFIRRGIIDRAITNPPPPLRRAFETLLEIKRRADRLRRPELNDEDALAAHYQAAIPEHIATAHALRKWLYKATQAELQAFRLDPEKWLPKDDDTGGDFPTHIIITGQKFTLTYRHTLNDEDDGITCTARASQAHALRSWQSDWLVPGAIREKLIWMIGALPSRERRILSPIEDTAARLITYLKPGETPLNEALVKAFRDHWGITIYPDAWDKIRMPAHFKVRYRIIDDKTKRTLSQSRNLEEALREAGIQNQTTNPQIQIDTQKSYTTWDFPPIPHQITSGRVGWQINEYPALKDNTTSVTIQNYATKEEAAQSHISGTTRLILLTLKTKADKAIWLPKWQVEQAYYINQIGYTTAKIAEEIHYAAVKESHLQNKDEIRTKEALQERITQSATTLTQTIATYQELIPKIITKAAKLNSELGIMNSEFDSNHKLSQQTIDAIKNQLTWLIFPGYIKTIPYQRLQHYPRYLDAISKRIIKAVQSPQTDLNREAEIQEYWQRYRSLITSKQLRHANRQALVDYRWMIEEYRVSLFAQELRTPTPISAKRLNAAWDAAIQSGVQSTK